MELAEDCVAKMSVSATTVLINRSIVGNYNFEHCVITNGMIFIENR
jgi:hypothetical protein